MNTFIVTNSRIAHVLCDTHGYKFPDNNDAVCSAGHLYLFGKLYDLDLYIDPFLSWTDNTVVFCDLEPNIVSNAHELTKYFHDRVIANKVIALKIDNEFLTQLGGPTPTDLDRPLTDFDAIV